MRVDVRTIRRLRRSLRFADINELLTEARALVAHATRHGEYQVLRADWPPTRTGVAYLANLNLARTLEHLARWLDISIDGAKFSGPPPIATFFARLLKPLIINSALPVGFILPPDADAATIPPLDTPLDGALAHLEASALRLAQSEQRAPSLIFGKLSAAEWEQLHLRHAELHLGYMHHVVGQAGSA